MINDEEGEWIQGDESIGEAACRYFEGQFTKPGGLIREDLLPCIPTMIKNEDNTKLSKDPTMLEHKDVVFSMNPTSAAGPDEMNGKFIQSCWEVIKNDMLNMVLSFFGGCVMPRYMTYAFLVILPTVEFPNSLTEFIPISLSNFINKIISKLICSRIAPILPNII